MNPRQPGPGRLARTLQEFARRVARPAAGKTAVRGEIVGVDVGSSGIKVARVLRSGKGARLVDFAEVALPAEIAADRLAAQQWLAESLRDLVRGHGLSGKPAVAMIHGLDVVLRRTSLPSLPHIDTVSALTLEAHKFVPFDSERIALDYEVVTRGQGGEEDVLLVAACDRKPLQAAREMLLGAGLKPRAITVAPLAFRSLMRHAHRDRQDVVALLDVGHQTTNLCIFKGDELRFSRELSLGSSAFTEALRTIIVPGQGALKLTGEEADRLKFEHGIPMGEEEKQIANGIPLASVGVMLRPVLERLAREIWSSFDYCNEEYFGESVTQVFLTGRGSRLKNLSPYLESVLKVGVHTLDAGRAVDSSSLRQNHDDDETLGFAPALALEDFTGINLLRGLDPAAPASVELVNSIATLPRVAALAVLAILVDGGLTELHRAEAVGKISAVRIARSQLAGSQPEIAGLEARMRAQQSHQAIRAALTAGQPDWALVMKDLSLRVSPSVWIKEMRPEEIRPDPSAPAGTPSQRRLVLETVLTSETGRPEREIATTLTSLAQSPFFQDVRLVESSAAEQGMTRVVIACTMRSAP